MVDLVKMEELAKAATPLDLSSAQKVGDGYEITCPVCDGEGEILAKDWCNIDGEAIGVQVYGIGEKMTAMERFIDAANPSTVLELIAALTSAKAEIERLKELVAKKDEALRPFKREYEGWATVPDDTTIMIGQVGYSSAPAEFTFGDLRRAAAEIGEKEPRT